MKNPSEYRREMDALKFSQEQKAGLVTRVRKAAEAEPRTVRHPMRRMVAAVAVVAVIATAGYGAMASGFVSSSFGSVFGTSQTKVINKIGRPIGAAATDHGITVTADAVIGDKYNACTVYTIKRTDGSPLKLPAGVPVNHLFFEQANCYLYKGLFNQGGSFGSAWFTASKSDANAVCYVEAISSDQPLNQGTAHADFKNLGYYDKDAQKSVMLGKGEWKFNFRVNYEDSSVALPAGETFTRDGIHFKITGVSVSPIGMRVAYEADREAVSAKDPPKSGKMNSQMESEMDRYLGVPIIITKKDGSKIDMTGAGGSTDPGKGKTNCVRAEVFEEILPLQNMKSITVGSAKIPINVK